MNKQETLSFLDACADLLEQDKNPDRAIQVNHLLTALMWRHVRDDFTEDEAQRLAQDTSISINIHNALHPTHTPAQNSLWEKISGIFAHPFWKAVSYIVVALGGWWLGS